jgi:hypothetical protein
MEENLYALFILCFAANTCRRPKVLMLGPRPGAFITRLFLEVNHHGPVAYVLLHFGYVNEIQHILYTYHVSRWFPHHLHNELDGYSIKQELLRGGHKGRPRAFYKGWILEPVGSGGIHGLLGSVGTRLANVVPGNRGRCSYRLYGAMGMVPKLAAEQRCHALST